MENVNSLESFIGYFIAWYPVIVPCVLLALAIGVGCGGRLLAWALEYVDDSEETAKNIGRQFLLKVLGLAPKAVNNSLPVPKVLLRRDSGPSDLAVGASQLYAGDYYVRFACCYWTYLVFRDKARADEAVKLIEVHGSNRAYALMERGSGNPVNNERLITTLLVYLCVLFGVLGCYKFAPALTVGIAVGYVVLRLARYAVRTKKKIVAHIADTSVHVSAPNAHKVEE